MEPTALPQLSAGQNASRATCNSAYARIRNTERTLDSRACTDLVYIRTIGWLYLLAEEDATVSSLTSWIHSCESDEDLVALGKNLVHVYLRLCNLSSLFLHQSLLIQALSSVRKYKGPTPPTSVHPSCTSFDKRREEIAEHSEVVPLDHAAAKKAVSVFLISDRATQ